MDWMFYGASSFDQNISGWNTGSVIDVTYMFYGATSFDQDLSGWDMRVVSNCSDMFKGSDMACHFGYWPLPVQQGQCDNAGGRGAPTMVPP